MSKRIVMSFTGSGGIEIPLLYYSTKLFEDNGYDVMRVNCSCAGKHEVENIYESIKHEIENMNLSEYDDIVLVSKSIGTYISCRLKAELKIPAKLILLTPLEQTIPYMREDNEIVFVAAGDKDRYLETERLVELCSKENIPYLIVEGVGHRMEVLYDLNKNLSVVQEVIENLQEQVRIDKNDN